jgi:hypothetical protein
VIRIFTFIVIIAAAVGAAASPSARLAALAGDGLLIEDAGADFLWPASVAAHGEFGALRARGCDEDLIHMRLEARSGLVGGVIVRVSADAVPDALSWRTAARERVTLQAARTWSSVSFGAGLYRDGPFDGEAGDSGRRGVILGVRLAPWTRHVLDVAVDGGETRKRIDDAWGGNVATWRLRYHGVVSERVIAVAAYENAEVRYAERGDPGHLAIEDRTWEFGAVLWPDADTQLTVTWIDRRKNDEWRRVEEDLERLERGFRVSVEARPSAWFTLRSGFSYLNVSIEGDVSGPMARWICREGRSTRVGCGASIHLGDVDLNVSGDRREGDVAAVGGLYPARFETMTGELVVRF